MSANELNRSLGVLFSELVNGQPKSPAYVLNGEDTGLLASLDKLSAEQASHSSQGGATIAAHTAHLQYGLSLMNRWAAGENPWKDADWSQAWKISGVDPAKWAELRRGLRHETERWLESQRTLREVSGSELDSTIGTTVHLAYHMGAIRQIDKEARGPKDAG
jgi:hypothetical protein